MPSSALFVIDIQKDMAEIPETRIPHASRVCDAASTLLDKTRTAIKATREAGSEPDWMIVFVQHEESPDSGALVKGTKPWELVFEPKGGDESEILVAKTTGGAFESNLALGKELRDRGVKNIVTCGIQSECCVLSTSKNALEEGFDVTILKGAHSTYDGKSKTAVDIEREVEKELSERAANIVDFEKWSP